MDERSREFRRALVDRDIMLAALWLLCFAIILVPAILIAVLG